MSEKLTENDDSVTSSKINDADVNETSLSDSKPDKELDDLLDSALEDFDKPKTSEVGSANKTASSANDSPGGPPYEEPGPWAAEFARLEESMKTAIDGDPELKEHLHKIAESAQKAVGASTDEEFAASLAETLRTINASASTFNEPPNEDELSRLMGSMGTGDGEDGFLGIMQNMMQNLLSKEVLYAPLKQITEKYPAWLDEKRSSLSAEELQRYEKQFSIMKDVCGELETEKDSDSTEEKKARFDRILALMQQMHECGHPPKELIEANPELAGSMAFPGMAGMGDFPGMPGVGNPESCCIQ